MTTTELNKNLIVADRYYSAQDAIRALKPGVTVIGLTQGKFSLIDLIYATLSKTGKAHVITATWSAGLKDIRSAKAAITSSRVIDWKVITDTSYRTRQAKYAATLDELFGQENIFQAEIHAKLVLIYNDNWQITINTSMNLNFNNKNENFEISTDSQRYTFYKTFTDNIINTTPSNTNRYSPKWQTKLF